MSYREWKDNDDYLHKEWRDEFGQFNRDFGPANIICLPNGVTFIEQFLIDGLLHRNSGPALIFYNPDGSIESEEFYINGEFLGLSKKGFWALWERLTEVERNNSNILKYLARYS